MQKDPKPKTFDDVVKMLQRRIKADGNSANVDEIIVSISGHFDDPARTVLHLLIKEWTSLTGFRCLTETQTDNGASSTHEVLEVAADKELAFHTGAVHRVLGGLPKKVERAINNVLGNPRAFDVCLSGRDCHGNGHVSLERYRIIPTAQVCGSCIQHKVQEPRE